MSRKHELATAIARFNTEQHHEPGAPLLPRSAEDDRCHQLALDVWSSEATNFLQFAQTDPHEPGAFHFSIKYGNIDRRKRFVPLGRLGDHPEPVWRYYEEGTKESRALRGLWEQQIRTMRMLTSLWLALSREDRALLGKCILWGKDRTRRSTVYFLCSALDCADSVTEAGTISDREVIASEEVHPEWLREFKEGDVIEPATRFLQFQVDRQLTTCVSGRQRLEWDRDRGFNFRFVADDLYGALWVSFAKAIAAKQTFRRCDECEAWFEIAPELARTNRRYCSESCRTKAYRGRQDRARQLSAQKKSFKEIAEVLDSDVATVKRWITGFKE